MNKYPKVWKQLKAGSTVMCTFNSGVKTTGRWTGKGLEVPAHQMYVSRNKIKRTFNNVTLLVD